VGIYFALHIDYFDINGIAVAGNKEISDEEIISLSKIETGDNLFDVHPIMAERRIKKNLYIEKVNVKRVLPNKIRIEVTERSGKAQFTMGSGKKLRYVVTDNDGMVLEIAKEQRNVTMIEGVDVKSAEKKKTIEVKQTGVYKKAMNIVQTAEDTDMYFKKIVISGSRVNAYVYDNLVCKGEYDNIMTTLENGAIKSVVFDLYQKGTEKGTINIGSNNYCSFTSAK
jgi:cell division protein FtsQ